MVCLKPFFQKKKLTFVYFKKMDTVHANHTAEAFLSRVDTLKGNQMITFNYIN